jgi:hypothetical protein
MCKKCNFIPLSRQAVPKSENSDALQKRKETEINKINLQTVLPEETYNAILPNLLSRHRFINFSKVCGNNPVVFGDTTERASKRQG